MLCNWGGCGLWLRLRSISSFLSMQDAHDIEHETGFTLSRCGRQAGSSSVRNPPIASATAPEPLQGACFLER